VTNTVTGETITFLETSAETGGVRIVAEITLRPGGSVIPHSHRVSESFEYLDGDFITHLAGKETEFTPGQRMIAEPSEMHGFRNDTAQPATPQGHHYTRWRPGSYSAHAQWTEPRWLAGAGLRRLSPVDVEGERRKPWQRRSQPTAIAAVAGERRAHRAATTN
jgi:mannose-6-phosphate isomerase-like protein (cupin superfamily)